MEHSKTKHILDADKTDVFAAVVRGATGAIPWIGNAIGELWLANMQNQWQDRATAFMKEMEHKVNSLPSELKEKLFQDQVFIFLLREALDAATKTNSEQRRAYLLHVVFNGIDQEEKIIANKQVILTMLNQINDAEIIWLIYYAKQDKNVSDAISFSRQHSNVYNSIPTKF